MKETSSSATSVLQWMEQHQRRNNRGLRPGFFMDDISGGCSNPSIFNVPWVFKKEKKSKILVQLPDQSSAWREIRFGITRKRARVVAYKCALMRTRERRKERRVPYVPNVVIKPTKLLLQLWMPIWAWNWISHWLTTTKMCSKIWNSPQMPNVHRLFLARKLN